ncbi:endonuclease/exonuclease/phosphatase family protein [Paenibacillus senegalensis]|uniref:endonuclease/exonuclease/phosphatase family protein n=1 Tax=Paenibacillus senegalensis TaxID=1465766 RepID=UPI0011DD03EB|nr:endonuclease/exonuclease/phosphatase family protein [Paenibacillus senegalensis]
MSTSANELRIMTYNVRVECDLSPNSWEERRLRIQKLITEQAPDIIGTQEGMFGQVKDLQALLPDYEWIGEGRDGGSQGEFMAIFYNRSRLELTEYGHFWLSDTPMMIGSKTWGNHHARMATWGRFEDRQSGKAFYLLNTHLDHQSEEARGKGARLLAAEADRFASGCPVILTGDFNAGEDSEPYRYLTGEGGFQDTWFEAASRDNETLGSFTGYTRPDGGQHRIDWILTKGEAQIIKAQIINTLIEGQFPSDHYPVTAILYI